MLPAIRFKFYSIRFSRAAGSSRGISQYKFTDSIAYKGLQFKRFVENNLLQLLVLASVLIALVTINNLSNDSVNKEDLLVAENNKNEQEVSYNARNNDESPAPAGIENQTMNNAAITAMLQKIENSHPSTLDVEQAALQLVQTENWTNDKIVALAHAWITLSKSQQYIYKQSVWFQLLENILVRKLSSDNSASASFDDEKHDELLASLALHLSIDIPSEPVENVAAVSSTEVKDLVPRATTEDADGFIDLGSRPDPQPSKLSQIVRSESVTIKPTVVENVLDPELIQGKTDKKLTKKEVSEITKRFEDYYQLGDIGQFSSLFSQDVTSNDVNDISGLKQEYSDLFKATAARKMIVDNIKWNFTGNQADGKGDMIVNINPGAGKQQSVYKGKIHIVMTKKDNKILITKFFHKIE